MVLILFASSLVSYSYPICLWLCSMMSRDLVVLVDPAVYGGGWCHDEVGLTGFGEKSEFRVA